MATRKSKSRPRVMYMHTLDGKPALYTPGEQVSFASAGRYMRRGIRLVPTLKQICAEWKASEAWRQSRGFATGRFEHSYVVVEVPVGSSSSQPGEPAK